MNIGTPVKTVAQHRLGLSSQDSFSEGSSARLQRKGSFREFFPNFKRLRQITLVNPSPPKASSPRIKKIIEKHPRCEKAYSKFKSTQKLLYLLLEDHTSSLWAKILFVILTFAILFTTMNAIMTSAIGTTDATQWVEFAISILFVIEYLLRVISATAFGDKFFKVMCGLFPLIDLLGLIPFFLEFGFAYDDETLTTVRLLKVIRVLKLGRYIKGSHVFYLGIKASLKNFGFLTLLIAVVNIVGATAIYYAECQPLHLDTEPNPRERITTLSEAMWYVMVTLATVGYGDYIPQTILGKILASGLAIAGMLIFSLPIAILGNNFQNTYTQHAENERVQKYKELKFEDDQKHVTDSQKEVFFMNERIRSIEETNKKIITMLTESEVLYKRVAKDLKHLYESVYADEDTMAKKAMQMKKEDSPSNVGTPLLGSSKIETRIKLYEKLNRAKQKINVATLFKKVQTRKPTGPDDTLNTSKDLQEGENIPTLALVRSSLSKPKKTIVPAEGLATRSKTRVPTNKLDLNNSDIVLESEGVEMSGNVPSMEQLIKLKTGDTFHTHIFDKMKSEINLQRDSRRRNRAIIKSHSVSNQNAFLSYYVQNLNFIPLDILEELLASDSDEENDDQTENSPNHFSKRLKANHRRRNSVSGETKVKPDLSQGGIMRQRRKRKKTRVIDLTKKGKFVPKDYDTRIWELTGKILDRMGEKVKIGDSVPNIEPGDQLNEISEIDKAIQAAQNELKRLQELKKKKTQPPVGDIPLSPLRNDEGRGKTFFLKPIDVSMELNRSLEGAMPLLGENSRADIGSIQVLSQRMDVIEEENSLNTEFMPNSRRKGIQNGESTPPKRSRWKFIADSAK